MTLAQPPGFLALPRTGSGPGVLLLHAWWGLNETIKTFCKQLAEAGFVVFAPDLYHGRTASTIPEAEALAGELDTWHKEAKAEIARAVKFLSELTGHPERGLAVVGFSLGAYYALDLSAADPEHIRKVVTFYGSGEADFTAARAVYMCHFAEADEYEPDENVAYLETGLKAAGRLAVFYRYPGAGHWFCEPDRTDAYNPEAARLAWERTLAFLKDTP